MPLAERRVTLPPARESARQARQLLKEAVIEAGRDEWLDNAELALSEVVTNALLHAHTDIEIVVNVNDDAVCVEVRDFDKTLPVQRHYGEEAITGRGLALVAAVTQECGVHSLGEAGKVVWFCVGNVKEAPSADELIDAWAVDFDEPDEPPPDTREVVLRGMPVALWLAAREHHDAIIRELCHWAAEHGDEADIDLAAADRARSTVSWTLIKWLEDAGREPRRLGEGVDWQELLPERIDLPISVPAAGAGMFSALQDTLDFAESLALDGRLLVHPALPEIVAVRDWACEQVIAQLMGTEASAWPGTAQERFETEVRDPNLPVPDWDETYVTNSERAVVAADDANRIVAVSRPLADMLGWECERLVGRRVVTIVPPALREAHVAGFSRHLSTGESHVLDKAVEVPVLTRDGAEVMCRLLIERAPTDAGRAVYVAWVDRLDDTDA